MELILMTLIFVDITLMYFRKQYKLAAIRVRARR